jgi:hypothetical protein
MQRPTQEVTTWIFTAKSEISYILLCHFIPNYLNYTTVLKDLLATFLLSPPPPFFGGASLLILCSITYIFAKNLVPEFS